MAVNFTQRDIQAGNNRLLFHGMVLMALTVFVALYLYADMNGTLWSYQYFFLLPWIFALGVVTVTPTIILYFQGKFSWANPLIFATWSYFFPAFVIGGLLFSLGFSQPSFTDLVQEPQTVYPLTIILIGLGFIGLSLGYFLPIGAKLGSLAGNWLPADKYPPSAFILPGILLLLIGEFSTFAAFGLGIFGYQIPDQVNSYFGLVALSTLYWIEGTFLLWWAVFSEKTIRISYAPVIAILIAAGVLNILLAGSRGTIVHVFTMVLIAYILAGRKFRFRQGVIAGVILAVCLVVGLIYGTTFRNIKGSEAQQSGEQYKDNVLKALDEVGKKDIGENLQMSFESFAGRVDIMSTLAVVVANYEQLKPYEEAYGLDNNIWTDLSTFLIPRVIWNDKPSASDARKYSALYFSFGENSFAITPIGDLLRNYGIVGVPIGMFILGIIIRFLYQTLVDEQRPSLWRSTVYFMLLTSISYEGFYGTIIPVLFKFGFTAVLGILFVNFIAKKTAGKLN
ncbi:hypothetical protein BH10ACI2_BH10ACI2_15230 [soil metagenome]